MDHKQDYFFREKRRLERQLQELYERRRSLEMPDPNMMNQSEKLTRGLALMSVREIIPVMEQKYKDFVASHECASAK